MKHAVHAIAYVVEENTQKAQYQSRHDNILAFDRAPILGFATNVDDHLGHRQDEEDDADAQFDALSA